MNVEEVILICKTKYLTKDKWGNIRTDFGLAISLINLRPDFNILNITMNYKRTLEEIKKIKKIEVKK
jgi:hypothetical protein